MTTIEAPTLFAGHMREYPGIPEDWSADKRDLAAKIIDDVRRFAPEFVANVIPGADIEDAFEDACRISAALRASFGRLELKEPGTAAKPWAADEMSRRLGPVASSEEGGHHSADRQSGHALVTKYGGRAMQACTLGVDPSTDAEYWLAARHRDAGVKRAVVKNTERKGGVWSIDLDTDPDVVRKRLWQAMDWTYARLEGGGLVLMAQDELPLEYETRLFVVDGRVISAAGCIEEFTPLDRDPFTAPFDTRVRRIRGHLKQGEPSPVEDRPDIAARLREFGAKVALEHGGTIVIDVAIDAATDEPVVIEFNGIANSGLYASDPWLVAKHLIGARDRGYEFG